MLKTDEYYEYGGKGNESDKIKLLRVIDGDTIDVWIEIMDDIGFGVIGKTSCDIRLRLARINAPDAVKDKPETRAAEKAATDALSVLLEAGIVKVRTYKVDSFHRYIADVWAYGRKPVNDLLVAQGHAEFKNYD